MRRRCRRWLRRACRRAATPFASRPPRSANRAGSLGVEDRAHRRCGHCQSPRHANTPKKPPAPPLLVLLAVAGCGAGGGGATPPTAEPCTGFDTQREPIALALDAERVYWADVGPNPGEGAIHAAAKACGARTTLARDQVNPRAVAVDGTHVYWVGDEGLARVAKGGGAVEKLADLIGPHRLRRRSRGRR